jgi:rhomboid family protein
MLILPIRTDRPRIRPAYLTVTLMVICTLVQIYSMVAEPVPREVTFEGETLTIEESPVIMFFGLWGNNPTLVTFFTHMFVHGDIFHLAGNMLFLWIFGSLIEDAIRPWGLAALYLGGGICAALAHIGMSLALGQSVDVPMVGASGAVAAIMGLFMLRFFKTKVEIFWALGWFIRGTFWVQSIWALGIWVGIEIVEGIMDATAPGGGGVAHWAHVGGFVAGAIAAPFIGSIHAAKEEYITDDPETNVEYVRRNEFVAAAEKALKADPSNAYQMRRVAQAYRHAGEYERATETYQRCIYRFGTRNMMEQAVEVYLELLQHNEAAVLPAEILLRIAQQLETQALVPHAVFAYQTLFSHYYSRSEGEFALLRLSVLYGQSLNQPHEALRCLNEFLHRYPQSEWSPQAQHARDALAHQYGWQ